MKIARRMLFKLLGGVGLSVLPPAGWLMAAPQAQPFFLILDDITVNTPVDALTTLLAPFSTLGIPVGLVLKLANTPAATSENAMALATTLGDFLRDYPDLAEAIPWLPDLGQGPPFVQIRRASDAKWRLEQFLGLNVVGKLNPSRLLTVAGQNRDGGLQLDALRAAGFRNALLLSQVQDVTISDQCDAAIPCVRGGVAHAVTDGTFDIIRSVRAAIGTGDMVLLSLSLAHIASVPQNALRLRAEAIADTIGTEMLANRVFAALPREHVFWFGPGNERLIALRIESPATGDLAATLAFTRLQTALVTAGIAFTVTGEDHTDLARLATDCLTLPPIDTQIDLGDALCAVGAALDADALAALAERGIEVLVQPVGLGSRGIDENGILRLPETLSLTAPPAAGFDMAEFAPAEDIILSVLPAAYETDTDLAAILGILSTTKTSTFLTIPDFAKAILPADPVYQLMQATRRDLTLPPAAPPAIPDTERATLVQDAKIAWSFFDRMTESATGLCPSTVHFEGAWSSVYRALTMWDYASLIQATIASHELGLIDDAQFLARAKAIVAALPVQIIGGLRLPSSEIATDRRRSLSGDYNACDTGRLLAALAALNRHPLAKGSCAEAVALWDLQGTLQGGRLHSVVDGRLVPLYGSHCAHYAARSFGLWGIQAASPYNEAMQGQSATDARMGLLYAVAQIGAIGAEPLLLEGVELGLSAPSAYLADVLSTAQARSFAATGALVCASEGPMDRAPWFSYQGLRVDAATDPWEVQPIDPSPDFASKQSLDAARVISTKAAFLWAALRPGDYSTRLLDYVRTHARASVAGYCSGTYSATATPMTNYTDINTNGIILQAIAHILRAKAG